MPDLAAVIQNGARRLGIASRFNRFDDASFLAYVAGKSCAFRQQASQIETLALRGSNADYGFFPDAFPRSFNLGLTSSDLYTAFQILFRHQADLARLKRIVLFASISTPGLSLVRTSERYRAVAYRHYFGVPYQAGGYIDWLPEWRIIRKCRRIPAVHPSEGPAGYRTKTFFLGDIDVAQRAAIHLRQNRRVPNQLEWLARLGDVARQNGWRLYVVLPPARADYRAALPPKRDLFDWALRDDGRDFGVIDCFDGPLAVDGYMGDPDHPNEDGAKAMTRHLRQVIDDREAIVVRTRTLNSRGKPEQTLNRELS